MRRFASLRLLLPVVAILACACSPTIESDVTGSGQGGHAPHGTGTAQGGHPPDGVGGFIAVTTVTTGTADGGFYPDGPGGYSPVGTGGYGGYPDGVGGYGGYYPDGVGGYGGYGGYPDGVGGFGGYPQGVGGSGGWYPDGAGGYGGFTGTVDVAVTSTHSVGAGGAPPIYCGGDVGVQCSPDRFCNFVSGTCGAADEPGKCREKPLDCAGPLGQPVCGCDGHFYEDKCNAHLAGFDDATDPTFCPPDPAYFQCGGEVCRATQYCFATQGSFAACGDLPAGCASCDCVGAMCPGGVCAVDAAGHVTISCP